MITRIRNGEFEAVYWVANVATQGEVQVKVNGDGANCTMCQPSHNCEHVQQVRSRLLKQSGLRFGRRMKQKAATNANSSQSLPGE